VLKPIFDNDRHKRAMRVAAFMSGSGTNILKILVIVLMGYQGARRLHMKMEYLILAMI